MSELVSLIMEPIANEWKGGLEVKSTGDFLNVLDKLNAGGMTRFQRDGDTEKSTNIYAENLPEGWKEGGAKGRRRQLPSWMQSNVEQTREEADGGEYEEAVKRPGINACAVSCGRPGQPSNEEQLSSPVEEVGPEAGGGGVAPPNK